MFASSTQSKRARARYLSQSIQLEESDAPGVFSAGILVAAMLMAGGVVWAGMTPVEEVAKSPGQIIPAGHHHQVQHLEGGIIAGIEVRDGHRVETGQVLVTLDSTAVQSQVAEARARLADLLLQRDRLDALREDRAPAFAQAQDYPGLAAKQLALFHGERESRASQLAVIDAQVRKRMAELEGHRLRASAMERQYALLVERRQMFEKLRGTGTVAAADLLATQARESEVLADLEQGRASVITGEKALAEAQDRRTELLERFRATSLAEAATVESELAQARETLRRAQDRMARLEVRSPVAGIVQGMTVNTLNQVIAPGAVILEVVPVSDIMVVQSRISPADVGHVRTGQPAKVAVDSFDVTRFGDIEGEVRQISASTFLADDGLPYYEVEIALHKGYVGDDPARHLLVPGMTVQADVITGRKTVLDYLMKPIYRGFNSAFTER